MSIITAVVVFLSEGWYIASIFKGKTKPSRSTFWIWTLVQGMTAASYAASGGEYAIALSVAYAAMFLFIAILSVPYGSGRWSRFDTYACLGALVSASVWVITQSSSTALVFLLATDLIGALPTIKKSHLCPTEEHRWAWCLTLVAIITNMFSVQHWSGADIAYSAYIFAVNAVIVMLVCRPVRKKPENTV